MVRLLGFGVFLLALLAALEYAARIAAYHSRNVSLQIVLKNYEFVARGEQRGFRFVPDEVLPYRLQPGFALQSPDGVQDTRHNSAGFRDDVEFTPKPEGVLRLICIGGSVTYGAGVQRNAETYPSCLARWMNNVFAPNGWKRVEVFNLGVGGYTALEDEENLRRFGLPLAPDAVLVQSGVNDVAPRFYPGFRCDYSHFRKRMEPLTAGPLMRWAYRSQLLLVTGWWLGLIEAPTLLSRTQTPLPAVDDALANLARNNTACFCAHVEEIITLCRESRIRAWLLTTPYLDAPAFRAPAEELRRLDEDGYRKGMQEHNALLRELAAREEVGLIDLERAMPPDRRLFTDPIHFSAEGNALAAKLIAEAVSGPLSR